jgi:hypothetical protein
MTLDSGEHDDDDDDETEKDDEKEQDNVCLGIGGKV